MKYKVWHIERKEWIHDTWSIYINPDGDVFEIVEAGSYDRYMDTTNLTDKVKIVRYTGLKDKNGKEIYEGDIVQIKINDYGNWVWEKYTVIYDQSKVRFCLKNDDEEWSFTSANEIEVFGNIYENPELLAKEE